MIIWTIGCSIDHPIAVLLWHLVINTLIAGGVIFWMQAWMKRASRPRPVPHG